MNRSFSIVDHKVAQAEFFLDRIPKENCDIFAAQCFADAFVSAARTVTFALQSVCGEIPGFAEWYLIQQDWLKTDPLAQFFHLYRNVSIHIGDTPVRTGGSYRDLDGQRHNAYFFMEAPDIHNPPEEDIYTVCRTHFTNILRIVLDAYYNFACFIDDRWYYTEENFQRIGKTIEDAEQELGFPRGWTDIDDATHLHERWRALRTHHTVGCEINHIFDEYLSKYFAGPDEVA